MEHFRLLMWCSFALGSILVIVGNEIDNIDLIKISQGMLFFFPFSLRFGNFK